MENAFDVVIIGGGITGAGIFRDCVLRGLKTLLLEKNAFGKGTTANSSCLLHGGLRYLAFDPEMTKQSCRDAGRILRLARPFCRRLPFIWPVYKHYRYGLEMIETVLEIYDDFNVLKGGKKHKRLSAAAACELIPGLNSHNLVGALTFDEWLIDPVLLTRRLLLEGHGSQALEQALVTGFTIQDNLIARVQYRTPTGATESVQARVVVNAAGPWVGRVAQLAGVSLPITLRKGIHLLYNSRLTPFAVMAQALNPKQYIFTIPRTNGTLVGPTDDPVPDNPDALEPSKEETQYVLESIRRVLPRIAENFDGVSVGLRPLVYQKNKDVLLSRDHELVDHAPRDGLANFLTMIGGKISTFRQMAQETTDAVCSKLKIEAECRTDRLTLEGYPLPEDWRLAPDPPGPKHFSAWAAKKKKIKAITLLARAYSRHLRERLTQNLKESGAQDFNLHYQETQNPAVEKLLENFGRERVRFEHDEILPYCRDKWPRSLWWSEDEIIQHRPLAAVLLKELRDAVLLLHLGHEMNLPIIPRGGGSGVCAAACATNNRAVIADMNCLNRISPLEKKTIQGRIITTVRAQTGILGSELEQYLNREGYTLGHFPASLAISTLGGWIATNSYGQLSSIHGGIKDRVLSLTAALPNGDIRCFEDNTAWVGSEGTLGIILEAVLEILPLPQMRLFQTYAFDNITAGIAAMREMLASGIKPAVSRLYDGLDNLINGPKEKNSMLATNLGHRLKLCVETALIEEAALVNRAVRASYANKILKPCLVLIYEGQEARQQKLKTAELMRGYPARDLGRYPAMIWWQQRYKLQFTNIIDFFKKGCFVDTLDVWAPWEHVANVYDNILQTLMPHVLVMAHISHQTKEGACLYFTITGKKNNRQETVALYDRVWALAMEACIAAEGRVNHHHNFGLAKQPWLNQGVEPAWLQSYRQAKKELDPANIMNPGKLKEPVSNHALG